jgi:hypothetical protein
MNPPKFQWRALISVLVTISFLILVLSGVMLFVSPPGRIANWTNWTLLGLRKHDWGGLHIWFGTVFLTVAVVHLILNWRPLVTYFKSKATRQVGFRWEWVIALVLCGAIYAGIRAGVPPFSSLLAFNEEIKESWDKPADRAPIPHAELLSLGELAQKAGVDLPTALSRLAAAGITNATAELMVGKLAERSQVSGQRIYQIILGNPTARGAEGNSGAGLGGGAGGGTGRKTLAQYCAEQNLVVTDALARLEAKGIHAKETLTLREIAVNNGYDKPFEIMEIINAK